MNVNHKKILQDCGTSQFTVVLSFCAELLSLIFMLCFTAAGFKFPMDNIGKNYR